MIQTVERACPFPITGFGREISRLRGLPDVQLQVLNGIAWRKHREGESDQHLEENRRQMAHLP